MLYYYHEIKENDITYSIDMIRLRLDFSTLDRINEFGSWLSLPYHLHVEMYPLSSKAFSYRYLYKLTCTNGCSFVCGLGFNGTDTSSGWIGFCEFNPNKVAGQPEFLEFFETLKGHCPWAEIVRYDVAIDVPLMRSQCSLAKDKRKYSIVQNSSEDVTEYLGQHNKSGFCKLYNKKKESDLEDELTRFEITLDYDLCYSEVIKIMPIIDVTEFQLDMDAELTLRDTEIVLVDLLKRLPIFEQRYYFNKLGRKMKQKIKPFVFSNIDKFCLSKEIYSALRMELRNYTIGVVYSPIDLIKDMQ